MSEKPINIQVADDRQEIVQSMPAQLTTEEKPSIQALISSLKKYRFTPFLKKKFTSSPEESQGLNKTEHFLQISHSSIVFGQSTLFPESFEEIQVKIRLKDEIFKQIRFNNCYFIQITANCNHQEFNDLKVYENDYTTNVRQQINRKERLKLWVCFNVPPIKENRVIEGSLNIRLENLQPLSLPLRAKCELRSLPSAQRIDRLEQNIS